MHRINLGACITCIVCGEGVTISWVSRWGVELGILEVLWSERRWLVNCDYHMSKWPGGSGRSHLSFNSNLKLISLLCCVDV